MTWTIDDAHTTVGFAVKHMGLSTVRGKFTRVEGTVDVDPGNLTAATGTIRIDASSIETGQPDRDTHLRSADFFDAETYPHITFSVKRVTAAGENLKVTGDLTIRDVTREVELDGEFAGEGNDPYGNRKIGGSLYGSISRGDFGLKWNVPVQAAGGLLVGDKVKLEIEGQLAESKAAVEQEAQAESV
ncbi:MAG: YceI family protein [Candidatus Dormibacteria bacterium]